MAFTIDLTTFEKYRKYIGHSWQVNGKIIQTNYLFYLIDKHIANGHTTIIAPYPVSDKPNESRWVWSGYSAEHFLEKVQYVYNSAIDEYMKMVNFTFKRFQSSLRIAVLSPCVIVGKLRFIENGATFVDEPGLTWYIKALPKNEQTCVDIQLGEIELNHDLLNLLHRNNMKLRPDAEDRGITRVTSEYVDICKPTPVTNLVFSWLEDELKEIGWIE